MSKNIQLQVTDPEANKVMDQISKRLDSIEKRLPKKPLSRLIDRKQVSQILGVSTITIIDWDKKEITKPIRIGTRIRYKLSDIESLLEPKSNSE